MQLELAKKIIGDMEKGYNLISEKFTQTRNHLWKDLEFIGSYCKKGDKVLDFGCGNGRLLDFLEKKEIEYTGLDISDKLLKEARNRFLNQKQAEFQKISGLDSLPLENDSFNIIYAIAVLHHVPGKEMRKKIVEEFYRILKPEGTIVITAWNLWQRKYIKNVIKSWLLKIVGVSLPPHQLSEMLSKLSFFAKIKFIFKRSNLFYGNWCGGEDWNDCYIDFQDNRGKIFSRYHHAFTKRELAELFSQAGFSIGKCDTINGKNIVLVGSK